MDEVSEGERPDVDLTALLRDVGDVPQDTIAAMIEHATDPSLPPADTALIPPDADDAVVAAEAPEVEADSDDADSDDEDAGSEDDFNASDADGIDSIEDDHAPHSD